ncbi:MAG TPA: hypothetical protein VKW08_16265 [Xanthobacteraceae bacterium]|jgi:hypothetical protein|nr:hypothetical protein [Xanthobacteraceae bacterium]
MTKARNFSIRAGNQLLDRRGSPSLALSRRSLLALGCLAPFATLPARAGEVVTFADLAVAGGEGYTDKARKLAGKTVEMRGYMAPPLKPEIDFFVLTSLPTAICPFCDAAASWPDDIVLVQLSRPVRALAYDVLLDVSGTLDIGEYTDERTGFVSLVRLNEAKYVKV